MAKTGKKAHKEFKEALFPSPCGVNIVAKQKIMVILTITDVSVPLRGKYRGEGVLSVPPLLGCTDPSFRPLAG